MNRRWTRFLRATMRARHGGGAQLIDGLSHGFTTDPQTAVEHVHVWTQGAMVNELFVTTTSTPPEPTPQTFQYRLIDPNRDGPAALALLEARPATAPTVHHCLVTVPTHVPALTLPGPPPPGTPPQGTTWSLTKRNDTTGTTTAVGTLWRGHDGDTWHESWVFLPYYEGPGLGFTLRADRTADGVDLTTFLHEQHTNHDPTTGEKLHQAVIRQWMST